MRSGEDSRRRLAPEVVDGVERIAPNAELRRVRLEDPTYERPVLVEGGTPERRVLLERERQLVVDEQPERAETERAQGPIEMWSADGHAPRYFAGGSSPPC